MFDQDNQQHDSLVVTETVHNTQETDRIIEVIKQSLGPLSNLSSKLPKPVLALVLMLTWAAPMLNKGDLGSMLSNLWALAANPANLGTGLNYLMYGIGFYSIYVLAALSQKAENAKKSPDSDLTVKLPVDPQVSKLKDSVQLLTAKNLLLNKQVTKLINNLEQENILTRRLITLLPESQLQRLVNGQRKVLDKLPVTSQLEKTGGCPDEESEQNYLQTNSSVRQSLRALAAPSPRASSTVTELGDSIASTGSQLSRASR